MEAMRPGAHVAFARCWSRIRPLRLCPGSLEGRDGLLLDRVEQLDS